MVTTSGAMTKAEQVARQLLEAIEGLLERQKQSGRAEEAREYAVGIRELCVGMATILTAYRPEVPQGRE